MITGVRCAKHLRLAQCGSMASSSIPRISPKAHVLRRHLTLTFPAVDVLPNYVESTEDIRRRLRVQKISDLNRVLELSPSSPSRVWKYYIELLNFVGLHQIPVEVHQKVLRACTADVDFVRVDFAKRFMRGASPFAPHPHEARFQAIIQNMREVGHSPTLDDYHFILHQFAAVGYHAGSLRVLQEMSRTGLKMTAKTYGLCLQALCHRLSLPHSRHRRPKLIAESAVVCTELTHQMHKDGVPFTSPVVDLVFRVLKETMDMEALQKFLKYAYGIDLSFPDRPPLEFWQSAHPQRDGAEDTSPTTPTHFSTAALNTTIDVLGSFRDVSKLVQTFEVLTSPLPSRVATVPSSSFEDDEDDDFGINRPAVAPFPLPYAEPNTRTFQTLLKWVSQSGHAVLARHYLLHAMDLDRIVDRQLRGDCMRCAPDDVIAPNFGVNRTMLLSVVGLANRDKNMELLRWVLIKTQRVLRRKRVDIKYYTEVLEKQRESIPEHPPHTEDSSVSTMTTRSNTDAQFANHATEAPLSQNIPSMPYFDIDFDSTAVFSEPRRKFDIELHLRLLQRDREDFEQLERYIVSTLARNTQRVKERLGRRIWDHKTVFLRTSSTREHIHSQDWSHKVNFREVKALEDIDDPESMWRPGRARESPEQPHKTFSNNFFTSATPH